MAETEYSIQVEHVEKSFRVFLDKGQSFKERLLFRKRNSYEIRPVLRDISFQVKRGEAVGLIGHNGCGKSTTLKLLTKILYPDKGTITMKGRVSSLIELGAGFHPDMSGRENIYTNASIFGLTKKEIDARLQTIIDFSELEEFIDNPVRTYSSGMYMRLAFSVAIHVNADILLIDEILGVGDVNFQQKCFQRLQEIKAAGTTIVIVSHAMEQIEQICDVPFGLTMGRFGKRAFQNMSMNTIFPPWKRNGLHGKQSIRRKSLNRNPRMQMIRQLCQHSVSQLRFGWAMVRCSLPMRRCWMQTEILVMHSQQGQRLP